MGKPFARTAELIEKTTVPSGGVQGVYSGVSTLDVTRSVV